MNIFKKLFGSGSPGTASLSGGARYRNTEWNFSLPLPRDWEVILENSIQDFPWTQPVRLAGPQEAHGRAYVTVVTQVIEDDGKGLGAYMVKAESDLRGAFNNFRLVKKSEQTLLGWPSAWMTYTYQGDSGPEGTQRDDLLWQGQDDVVPVSVRDSGGAGTPRLSDFREHH